MALPATKLNEDALHARGAKDSALPPGFCPARNRLPLVAYSGATSRDKSRHATQECFTGAYNKLLATSNLRGGFWRAPNFPETQEC